VPHLAVHVLEQSKPVATFNKSRPARSMMVNSNVAENLKPADTTKLVFNQCGSRHFLSEIWVDGAISGRQLPKTSRGKELARDVAQDLARGPVEVVASLQ
jgi:hypothetical protein